MLEHPWVERERTNPLPDMHGRDWGRWWLDARTFYLRAIDSPISVDLTKIAGRGSLVDLMYRVDRASDVVDVFDKGDIRQAILDIAGTRDPDCLCGSLALNLPRLRLLQELPRSLDDAAVRSVRGVYAIRAGEQVKIGRASDIEKRRAQLQTGNPMKLDVVAVLSLNPTTEARWHALMANARIGGGEWFHLGEQVAIHIRRARSTTSTLAIELTDGLLR